MLYLDYHSFRKKYWEVQNEYNKLLNEKEALFALTQPKSMQYDKEKVNSSIQSNAFDEYLIAKEKKRIDERLIELRSLLDDREHLLAAKKRELK